VRIAVAGARGQLGAALVHELAPAHETIALGRAELDIANDRAVAAAMAKFAPDVVINCAGYNDVDGAEDHPVDALNANAFPARAFAHAAAARGAVFVQYSSDFVFDGTKTEPYTEEDRPNPRSVYAASKLLGEWFAADAPRSYVLRVESLFGQAPGGPEPKGSIGAMVKKLLAGEDVVAFADRTVSPTYILDAARATRLLLESNAAPGLYHCVNSGSGTWLELARELANRLGVAANLVPKQFADVKLRAARPQYCALSNGKLHAAGVAMPDWRDALGRYLQTLRSEPADQLSHRQA
jgi:dTDP-4-dehydrorhamnose reductase